MSDGEMAYMALVLTCFFTFAIVLFALSRGLRDTTKPAARPAAKLPQGGAKAAV
ncbi:MAG: hypothetical protein JO021_17265 [Alphaproteobacteria bacterium]|nr:hypothetical protein [Alphaproteobacteria bacterium]